MSEEGARVVTERRGDALLVGINRPDKRNALDKATTSELGRVIAEAAAEPCILVVHSTTPGMFVAGADIAELVERDADDAFSAINAGQFERLEAHRWPTIAVVDGPALG
ncbi:MAG: enoyl-CoA hydratase/isomerase family protein, partial [Acidimicrobiia bacterium]